MATNLPVKGRVRDTANSSPFEGLTYLETPNMHTLWPLINGPVMIGVGVGKIREGKRKGLLG